MDVRGCSSLSRAHSRKCRRTSPCCSDKAQILNLGPLIRHNLCGEVVLHLRCSSPLEGRLTGSVSSLAIQSPHMLVEGKPNLHPLHLGHCIERAVCFKLWPSIWRSCGCSVRICRISYNCGAHYEISQPEWARSTSKCPGFTCGGTLFDAWPVLCRFEDRYYKSSRHCTCRAVYNGSKQGSFEHLPAISRLQPTQCRTVTETTCKVSC